MKKQNAYEPYLKEAKAFIPMGIVILLTSCFCLIYGHIANEPKLAPIIVNLFWFCCTSLINILFFRLPCLIIIEKRFPVWIEQDVVIEDVKGDLSISYLLTKRDSGYNSCIPTLYDEKQHVDRHKLVCRTPEGKKLVLRTAWGCKKYQLIHSRKSEGQSTKCTIYYGKFTKIVMRFDGKQDWTDRLNHML